MTPLCWCGQPADVLVTVDPYATPATHSITHRGWLHEPAVAVCVPHLTHMSGQWFNLEDGVLDDRWS